MNNRTLGTIAMICAPAMLLELAAPRENPVYIGIASMLFMAGWICSNIGMQRIAAAGTSLWGRIVLNIQLVGLVMACLFGFFEATQILPEDNLIFIATDLAWPLSMLFMIVVGVTVIVAGRLRGWRRFVPLLCGLGLPIGILASLAFGWPMDSQASGILFFSWLGIFWLLLGFIVYSSEAATQTTRAYSAA
jgi:hypothetical protein